MSAAEIHARTLGLERFRILGLELLPLTLGHLRLMEALNCYEARDPGELGLACIICSRPAALVMPFLKSWLFPVRLLVWRLILGKWDFAEKRGDFLDYMRFNTELPEVTRKSEEQGQTTCVPPFRAIRVRLMSEFGVDPRNIDDYRVLQALWDITSLDVLKGRATMLNRTSANIQAEMDSIDWDKVTARGSAILGGSRN